MDSQELKIKKVSLENFSISKEMENLIDRLENEDHKKELQKLAFRIKKNDKLFLKTSGVKFSDKEKKNLLDMKPLLT